LASHLLPIGKKLALISNQTFFLLLDEMSWGTGTVSEGLGAKCTTTEEQFVKLQD